MPNIKFKEGTRALSSNLYASQDYIQSTVTTVEVPSSVKQIGDAYGSISSAYGIFANCTSLQTVLLPKGLESIADRTFSDCTSLKNITIPNSLQYVGNRAFGIVCNHTKTTDNNWYQEIIKHWNTALSKF